MNPRTANGEVDACRLPLGRFQLDVVRGELLTVEGELAGLRRQALEVLLVLGRRAGQVVSKEDLMATVWPRAVVGDGSLTQVIAEIRKALGDGDHALVRNIARRGYMLVPHEAAPATPAPASFAPAVPLQSVAASMSPPPPHAPKPPWRPAPMIIGLGVGLILLVGTWLALPDRASRWQTPEAALRAPLPENVPALSIAVLPLTVEADATDIHWLADALHADLVTELAQAPDSTVIARDTMVAYAAKVIDPRQLARELGVRYVVRGTIRREGSAIRLNLVLVDGDSGVQRWGQTFLAEHATLAQTLGDFAMQLERALQMQLVINGASRRMALSPEQVGADELAMRAWALWYRGFNRDNLTAALPLLDRAVRIDPGSVRAWSGIAVMQVHGMLNGWGIDRAAALLRIKEAVTHLDRADRDGNATYVAKTIPLFMQGDAAAMLIHTQAWVDRHRSAIGYGAHGLALLLNGRFDDAAQAEQRALRLSPPDAFRAEWQYRLAMAHFAAGRYELARDWGQTAATTNPALRWPPVHAAALLRLGQAGAARQVIDGSPSTSIPVNAASLRLRLPGDDPRLSAARDRLLAALREAGMQ